MLALIYRNLTTAVFMLAFLGFAQEMARKNPQYGEMSRMLTNMTGSHSLAHAILNPFDTIVSAAFIPTHLLQVSIMLSGEMISLIGRIL